MILSIHFPSLFFSFFTLWYKEKCEYSPVLIGISILVKNDNREFYFEYFFLLDDFPVTSIYSMNFLYFCSWSLAPFYVPPVWFWARFFRREKWAKRHWNEIRWKTASEKICDGETNKKLIRDKVVKLEELVNYFRKNVKKSVR